VGHPGETPRSDALPGTVIAAIALAGFNAFIGLLFAPLGLPWTLLYTAGAVGTWRRQSWGYWLLLVLTGLTWFLSLLAGRIDVISTTLAIFVLLLTPSARRAFGLGRG
jgi:hypothetical protein